MDWGEPDPMFEVQLRGPRPYGFRVTGGTDYGMPLRISLVRDESCASEAQLEAGIRILNINGQPTSQMTQKEAKSLVKRSDEKLELMLEGSSTCTLAKVLPPAEPLENTKSFTKRTTTAAKSNNFESTTYEAEVHRNNPMFMQTTDEADGSSFVIQPEESPFVFASTDSPYMMEPIPESTTPSKKSSRSAAGSVRSSASSKQSTVGRKSIRSMFGSIRSGKSSKTDRKNDAFDDGSVLDINSNSPSIMGSAMDLNDNPSVAGSVRADAKSNRSVLGSLRSIHSRSSKADRKRDPYAAGSIREEPSVMGSMHSLHSRSSKMKGPSVAGSVRENPSIMGSMVSINSRSSKGSKKGPSGSVRDNKSHMGSMISINSKSSKGSRKQGASVAGSARDNPSRMRSMLSINSRSSKASTKKGSSITGSRRDLQSNRSHGGSSRDPSLMGSVKGLDSNNPSLMGSIRDMSSNASVSGSVTNGPTSGYHRTPMTVPPGMITDRPGSMDKDRKSLGHMMDLPDERDSGYSQTPSVISAVTEAEESDPPPPYAGLPPPAPPPPPPPPPPDAGPSTGMSCARCGKDVKPRDLFVEIEDQKWHGSCLTCKVCETALFHQDYRVQSGIPLCMEHAGF